MSHDGADMIIGSRFIEKKGFQSSGVRRMGIRYFTNILNVLFGVRISDPTSGFRMVNKKLIKEFAADYPKDYPEPESLAYILRRGYEVEEIPVKMNERQGGISSINVKNSIYYMIKVSIAIFLEKIR